jgi:F-type H+-transporting ATPase subunit a
VPKKKLLGCSFPVVIIIGVVLIALVLISFLAGPIGSSLFPNLNLPSWMKVPQPAPELQAEEIFHVAGFPITNTLITTWISMALLVILAILATRRMKMVPRGLQGIFEFAIVSLLNFCQSIAGEKNGRRIFPIVATIFLFVFINAWTSLIPGYGSITVHIHGADVPLLRGANTDINLPLALAIISFITVEYFGLKSLGVRYLGKFVRVTGLAKGFKSLFQGKFKAAISGILFGAIELFVGFLEAISELARLVSFTFRLFGNMTAGEILLLSISFLVPWFVTVPFYGLELLIGFVQALAFSMLTLIFMTIAVAGHDSEEAEEHSGKA